MEVIKFEICLSSKCRFVKKSEHHIKTALNKTFKIKTLSRKVSVENTVQQKCRFSTTTLETRRDVKIDRKS